MPFIDLSILNQRQTPAFYADVLANRPAAGFIGRIFVSTDTFAFYRDNGTTWDLIGGPGTGTVTGTGANGQVTFWNGASTITGSNDLFWDAANGHFGIGTNTPGTALGINHDQNQIIQINQTTATNDTKIAFQNSGVGLWRIGNSYNGGANDFAIYDNIGAIQPVTVKKTTGQVLIGTSTVGAGKLVVASATGDNGVQIVGATSPSLRIDNAEVGATKRIGIGLATAVNNFIQNSQNLDMCIFNSSTSAAGNMLFGIYDTGLANTQEAARISSARNFLIGTIVDAGQKLQVSGTALITGAATFSSSVTATQNIIQQTTDSDFLALKINHIPATNSNTTVGYIGFYSNPGNGSNNTLSTGRIYGKFDGNSYPQARLTFATVTDSDTYQDVMTLKNTYVGIGITTPARTLDVAGVTRSTAFDVYANSALSGFLIQEQLWAGGSSTNLAIAAETGNAITFYTNGTGSQRAQISTSGNLLIGTTTDAGQKLQVNGDIRGNIINSENGTTASLGIGGSANITTISNLSWKLVQANGDSNTTNYATAIAYCNSVGGVTIIALGSSGLVFTSSGANQITITNAGTAQTISYTSITLK